MSEGGRKPQKMKKAVGQCAVKSNVDEEELCKVGPSKQVETNPGQSWPKTRKFNSNYCCLIS